MLRYKPWRKGVDVVRCLDAARCKLGVSAESNNFESSCITGVETSGVGEDTAKDFLIGELWRAPEGLLTLLDVSKEAGRDAVLLSTGVGLTREELGALQGLLCWGLTETTCEGVDGPWVLNGLIGLE